MLGITDDEMHKPTRKRKKKGITFNDDEEVINPEDVDPSVGRFRNLIQTTVVPSKVCVMISYDYKKGNECATIKRIYNLYEKHMLFFVAENAYGRRSHIIVGRSQSSEAYATYVHHSSSLSRSTSRTIYAVLDVQSVLHGSHVANVAARYRITESGTRSGDDSESSTDRSTTRTGASAEYNRAADDGTEEEEIRQRGMAWKKTDTNAPCIIEKITVRIIIVLLSIF